MATPYFEACLHTVRPDAEDRAFSGAGLDVLNFRLRSFIAFLIAYIEDRYEQFFTFERQLAICLNVPLAVQFS